MKNKTKKLTKAEKEKLIQYKTLLDINLKNIHNKGALFYGLSYMEKYKKKVIATYYYYDIKNKKILDIKVILKKFNLKDPKYLIFKIDDKKKLFNNKLKLKLIKLKTLFKRMINYNNLYNEFNFSTAFLYSEVTNVKNIEELYEQHLENIKLQILQIYNENNNLNKNN